MATIQEQAVRLKQELDEALNDGRYNNLSYVAEENLTHGARNYLRRQQGKITRLSHQYELYLRIQRIIDGEVFSIEDIDRCRLEILRQYPEYREPITSSSGILFAAEAILKSFGRKYYLPLYRYPIIIDFGTTNNRICIVHPSNFIKYRTKEEAKK